MGRRWTSGGLAYSLFVSCLVKVDSGDVKEEMDELSLDLRCTNAGEFGGARRQLGVVEQDGDATKKVKRRR